MNIDWSKVKTKEQKEQEAYENVLNSTITNRYRAYQEEADPLFFKYQAGEVTKEEWLAKREEIKTRFPYSS